MQITFLELQNFRNIDFLSAQFHPGCNIVYGENGQGKTNILESIYMCGFGKSHKNIKEKDIIENGFQESHIRADFESQFVSHRVDIHLRKTKPKGMALNRIPIRKFGDLYGKILVVMFSSEDLDIVRRSPSDRRRFMDMELCQIDPVYLDNLVCYNRILNQRRELFRQIEEKNDVHDFQSVLDVLDLQLSEYGGRLIRRRREFIEELNSVILDIHSGITGGREILRVLYEPSVEEEQFYEILLKNRERDRIYKQTHAGPHRDDLSFFSSDKDLKVYGSSGQQRSCAISLKLSEIYMIEKIKKEKPVLLLDDVLSELDRNRQTQLIGSLKDVQTILTCTGMDEFVEEQLGEVNRIHVADGKIID